MYLSCNKQHVAGQHVACYRQHVCCGKLEIDMPGGEGDGSRAEWASGKKREAQSWKLNGLYFIKYFRRIVVLRLPAYVNVIGALKSQQMTLRNAAFTSDTCSPDTSCIHLYPDTSCSSGILVAAATCIWCKRGLTFVERLLSTTVCLCAAVFFYLRNLISLIRLRFFDFRRTGKHVRTIQVRYRKGPLSQKSAGHMQNHKTKTN